MNSHRIVLVRITIQKAFFLYRHLAGRPERIELGKFPAMTAEHARMKAATVQDAMTPGENSATTKCAVKVEPIFGAFFDLFFRANPPATLTTVTGDGV